MILKSRGLFIYLLVILTTFLSCKVNNVEKSLLYRIVVPITGKHYHKKWFFSGSTGNETTTIPFEIINGWIVIKVKFDDQDNYYRFVFDTGAVTSIELEIARELNLPSLMDFTTTDLNGVKHPANLINLKKLIIGGRTFLKVGALSSHTDLFTCYDIKGIFGYNLIGDASFRINFKNQTITITNQRNYFNSDDFHSVKITTDWKRVMYVSLKTENQKKKIVVDTGAPNYLILNNAWKPELNEEHLLQKRLQYISAASSSIFDTLSIYKAHNLRLDNLPLDKDVFILTKANSVIGKGFLEGFEEVIIDMKKNRLYLSKMEIEKTGTTKLLNFNMDWKDGAVRITGLTIDSELQKMGIKMYDQVVSINNVDTSIFQDVCAYRTFETAANIFKNDMKLAILREGQRYDYVISKATMYDE